MILYKTELAVAELQSDKRTLSLLERRVLLFVNERRTLDEVRALLSFPDSGEIIYLLEKKGYLSSGSGKQPETPASAVSAVENLLWQIKPLIAPIAAGGLFARPKTQPAKASPARIRPAPAPARTVMAPQAEALQDSARPAQVPQPAIDEDAMLAIKHIITETSGEHLGIFSRELLDKTERARDAAQLRTCISQWHMAMQESRSGRDGCMDWLNEVNELLHHGIAQELKSA